MVTDENPEQVLSNVVRQGLELFRDTVDGVTAILRTGDAAIRDLDSALTGQDSVTPLDPEHSFLEVVAVIQSAIQDAREKGTATAPSVVQRAREALARVSKSEPAWRPGPSLVRTANDVFRVALRDLRASQNLLRVAQGAGSLDDLENLSKWAGEVSGRIDKMQGHREAPQSASPSGGAPEAPAEEEKPPLTPLTPKAKKAKKKDTTPKTKPNPDNVVFARAVADEIGDTKVRDWAQDFADGKISESQWINRLTTHASATRETLDDVFDRATARLAGGQGGKQEGTD